eukprot:g35823.t1
MDCMVILGNTKGGRVYLLTKTSRCSDVASLESYCSPYLEYLTVKYRPYYLPHEFTPAILTAINIPPQVEVKNALAYKQKLKRGDPVWKVVLCWSEAVEELLWDCLELVNWSIFKVSAANLDEHATTTMDFI